MLLTTIEELNALLPANVSCNATRLLALMEQTEESYLRTILGRSLFAAIGKEYQRIVADPELGVAAILPDVTQPQAATPAIHLIRLLQVPLVYMTLANNASLLSVSLNDGGLNAVSAEGYDAISKDDREAFAKDCYLNAHRGIERVLHFLEDDAMSANPVFLAKWRQSPSFYQQNDLFLRTASALDMYVFINDSRETYLNFLPSLRRAQNNYIRPELGDRLTDALIAYGILGPQPTAKEDTFTEDTSADDTSADDTAADDTAAEETPAEEDAAAPSVNPFEETTDEEDLYAYSNPFALSSADLDELRRYFPVRRTAQSTAEDKLKLIAWSNAIRLASMAVAYYAEDDMKKYRRPESRNDAMRSLARLKELIQGNTAAFEGVVEQSPLYTPALYEAPSDDESAPLRTDPRPDASQGYVHDPFGTFYL
jgi:hypothetical protein